MPSSCPFARPGDGCSLTGRLPVGKRSPCVTGADYKTCVYWHLRVFLLRPITAIWCLVATIMFVAAIR